MTRTTFSVESRRLMRPAGERSKESWAGNCRWMSVFENGSKSQSRQHNPVQIEPSTGSVTNNSSKGTCSSRTKIRTNPRNAGETGGKPKQCCRKCCTRPGVGSDRRRLAQAARAHSPRDARVDRLIAFSSPAVYDQAAETQGGEDDAAGFGNSYDACQTESEAADLGVVAPRPAAGLAHG